MLSLGKSPNANKQQKNVAISCNGRELGVSKRATGPCKYMGWAAEERLILKTHEEFPCHLPEGTRSTFLMVFSPDGSMVASTHGNHNIYITDVRSGRVVKTLSGHPRTPWCIAFHPSSNQILASGCLGGQVRVWDLHGGSETWNAESQTVIASLAFHPTDRVLVIASYNEIHFWDWSQERPFAKCNTLNEREKVRFVSFDQLGHKLVTGIANVVPRQSQWDRVSAPQPSPQVSQLEHERRITICYRYMVEQYEQLVERYIQLSAQNPNSSSSWRRVPITPLTIDRGTDPMDEPSPSTSARPGAPFTSSAHCEFCQVDLAGRSRSSSTASNASSSSTSSNSRPTSSPNRTLTDDASSNASEESRPPPRGTNEINASHSSSRLVVTSTSLPSTSSAFVTPMSRSTTAVTPTSSSSSHPAPSAPPSSGHTSDRTVLLRNLRASYMYNRLHRFRAQVETGRNMLVMARTISLMSPSAPGDAGPLIDDPPSETLPPPPPPPPPPGVIPPYSPSSSFVFPPLPSPPPSPPPPPPPPLPTHLRPSSTPSTSTSSTPNSSGRRILPNILHFMSSFLSPNKDQPQSTSGTDAAPEDPEGSTSDPSSNPPDTSSHPCPSQLDHQSTSTNPNSSPPPSSASEGTVTSLPSTAQPSNPEGRPSRIRGRDPSGSPSPFVRCGCSSSSELATRRRFCNFGFVRRPFNSSAEPSTSSIFSCPTSQEGRLPRTGSSATVASTSSQAGPSTTCGSARSRVFLGSSPSSSRQPDEPAAEPNQSEDEQSTNQYEGDDSMDGDSAVNRLRAQFRSLQSVYYNNRAREAHLLRVAAENAERRLLSRLLNVFGRSGSQGRGMVLSTAEPGHDLRSIRYGLQLLRQNIYSMSRNYRLIVDRRRLDRIWRLWLDLQSEIFVLQRLSREEETNPDASALADDPEPEGMDNMQWPPSTVNADENTQTEDTPLPVTPRPSRAVVILVTPSPSPSAEESFSSNQEIPPRRGTSGSPVIAADSSHRPSRNPLLSTTTDEDSSDPTPGSPWRRLTPTGGPPLSRRPRISRTHIRPSKRARCGHSHRGTGRCLSALRSRTCPQDQAGPSLHGANDEGDDDDDDDDDDDFDLMTVRRPSDSPLPGSLKRSRFRSSLPASQSTPSDVRPSTSALRNTLPSRAARGRSRRVNVRIIPRFAEFQRLLNTTSNSSPQPGPSNAGSSGSPGARPPIMTMKCLRSRVRHWLLLMLDSLTQFFENDSFVRNSSPENASERVSSLIRLLVLAYDLTQLLLKNLRLRMRRDIGVSRRRPFSSSHSFPSFNFRSSRSEPVLTASTSSGAGSSSSSGGPSASTSGFARMSPAWPAPNPPSSTSATGNRGVRLPILLLNDGPVPPESEANPSSQPSGSSPAAGSAPAAGSSHQSATARPASPMRLHHPRRYLHAYHHYHHGHDHHMSDESSEEPSNQDRSEVLFFNRSFHSNGSGSSFFMPEAPSAPHHRVQVWDFTKFTLPEIDCPDKNLVVAECKIHNDASIDISKDGTIIVTLLPNGRLSHITTMLGVYSLSWGSLGQCLYTTSFEQNAVSVSLSPTARHLVVGLASRRIFLLQAERPTTSVAQIFRLEGGKLVLKTDSPPAKGKLALVRDLQIGEFVDFMSINCIRWSPVPGQGLIYGTNSGKLKILR